MSFDLKYLEHFRKLCCVHLTSTIKIFFSDFLHWTEDLYNTGSRILHNIIRYKLVSVGFLQFYKAATCSMKLQWKSLPHKNIASGQNELFRVTTGQQPADIYQTLNALSGANLCSVDSLSASPLRPRVLSVGTRYCRHKLHPIWTLELLALDTWAWN